MSQGLEVEPVLARHLGDPASSFSVGSLGAIAEFHRDPDEPLTLDDTGNLRIATDRGALAIGDCADLVPLAYEIPSANRARWQHGIVFCLPADRAYSAGRAVVTELGPDTDAIRKADRRALLFDMGLETANVDFCIRTGDLQLIEMLRASLGRSVFDPDNPVMGAILEANPHRIAISAAARAEVFQAIGRSVTPEGPHTHVLPNLLATRRTHESRIPVPDGLLPCLSLYPANPLLDRIGRERAFDRQSLEAFLPFVEAWATSEYADEKRRTNKALDAGTGPEAFEGPHSRIARTARKVALRQRCQTDPNTLVLAAWQNAFDAPARKGDSA